MQQAKKAADIEKLGISFDIPDIVMTPQFTDDAEEELPKEQEPVEVPGVASEDAAGQIELPIEMPETEENALSGMSVIEQEVAAPSDGKRFPIRGRKLIIAGFVLLTIGVVMSMMGTKARSTTAQGEAFQNTLEALDSLGLKSASYLSTGYIVAGIIEIIRSVNQQNIESQDKENAAKPKLRGRLLLLLGVAALLASLSSGDVDVSNLNLGQLLTLVLQYASKVYIGLLAAGGQQFLSSAAELLGWEMKHTQQQNGALPEAAVETQTNTLVPLPEEVPVEEVLEEISAAVAKTQETANTSTEGTPVPEKEVTVDRQQAPAMEEIPSVEGDAPARRLGEIPAGDEETPVAEEAAEVAEEAAEVAEEQQAPAVEEIPSAEGDAPARRLGETPAADEETPAADETPAGDEETPVAEEAAEVAEEQQAPAVEEIPQVEGDAPARRLGETPVAEEEETPVADEETPVAAEAAEVAEEQQAPATEEIPQVEGDAPARRLGETAVGEEEETPAADEETPAAEVAEEAAVQEQQAPAVEEIPPVEGDAPVGRLLETSVAEDGDAAEE